MRKYLRLRAAGGPNGMPLEIQLTAPPRGPYRLDEPTPIEQRFGHAAGTGSWITESSRPDVCAREHTNCLRVRCPKPEPWTVSRHLNEWLRFRQAGRYRVYIRSARTWGGHESISNIVEVDIIKPGQAWMAAHWQELLRAWRQPGERQTAARAIQYLGTPEAARFMAAHLDEPGIFGVRTLLAVSPLEMLLALRETPAAQHESIQYRQAVRLAWLRMLQPVRLPYGPHEEQMTKAHWREEVERWAAAVNRAVVTQGID